MESSTYALNSAQFEQALAIIDRERKANTPTPWQERAAKLLNVAIYGLALGPLLVIIVLLVMSWGGLSHVWERYFGQIFLSIIAWVFLLSIGITVLFFLNLRYIRQLRRRRKLARELGVLDAIHAPWKMERRKKRLRTILDLAVRITALLQVPIFLVFFMVVGSDMGPGWTPWVIGGLVLVFAIVISAILVTYFTRRSRARLEFISRLHSSLEKYKQVEGAEDSVVHIPSETYEKIAQIERAQISVQRVQSIMRAPEDPAGYYVLQKSREAQETQAKLDAFTRVRVQDRIDALAIEPRPPGVIEDRERGMLRLSVPDTPVTISFSVDEQDRRIQIYSVEPAES